MIPRSLPLLVLALSSVLCAPAASDDGYTVTERGSKRAALVLDRLLVALQRALREGEGEREDGPRTAPLRFAPPDENMMAVASGEPAPEFGLHNFDGPAAAAAIRVNDNMSYLQRRGQNGGRGRVLRCYFNAITCF